MKYWYAVFVKTGEEDDVCKKISIISEKDEIVTLVPKRIVPEKHNGVFVYKTKLLYPGYVLINTAETKPRLYEKVLEIPSVYKWIHNNGVLSPLYEEEVAILLKLVDEIGIIQKSYAIVKNTNIKIVEGPLKDNYCIIQKFDKHKKRAKVKLSPYGNEKLIDLGIDFIKV